MSFAKKIATFGLAAAAMTSTASAQPLGQLVAPRPTPGDTMAPAVKKAKPPVIGKGFTVMNIGVVHNQNGIFNGGTQFDAHANVSAGDPGSFMNDFVQLKGGFSLRDKSLRFENRFQFPGGNASNIFIYKPSEAYLDLQLGPKGRLGDKLLIMPYVSVGGSNGFGSSVNFLNTFSPRAAVGVNFLIGNISREGLDKNGNPIQLDRATTALTGFIEFGRQRYNPNTLRFFGENQRDPNKPAVRAGLSFGLAL